MLFSTIKRVITDMNVICEHYEHCINSLPANYFRGDRDDMGDTNGFFRQQELWRFLCFHKEIQSVYESHVLLVQKLGPLCGSGDSVAMV